MPSKCQGLVIKWRKALNTEKGPLIQILRAMFEEEKEKVGGKTDLAVQPAKPVRTKPETILTTQVRYPTAPSTGLSSHLATTPDMPWALLPHRREVFFLVLILECPSPIQTSKASPGSHGALPLGWRMWFAYCRFWRNRLNHRFLQIELNNRFCIETPLDLSPCHIWKTELFSEGRCFNRALIEKCKVWTRDADAA